MIDNADKSFKNSAEYMQMEKHINILELKIKAYLILYNII
ncbi:hypothetical protein CNEO_60012 [Clostridium neonatale]|nr:hypothetical protein CNEO_60012 [Clostridium neonatale]